MNIDVFPEYLSTGLWDSETRANTCLESEDPIRRGLLAGIGQWHWLWEALVAENRLSDFGLSMWKEDGARLVEALNLAYAGEHTFVYRTDLL